MAHMKYRLKNCCLAFFTLSILLVLCTPNGQAAQASVASAHKKSWVSIFVWDAFTPLVLEKSVPEMLVSLENIFQMHIRYQIAKTLFGKVNGYNKYGNRSTEGHYMMWLHLSDEALKQHAIDRKGIGEEKFIFKNYDNDIFTGWSGQANFKEFIINGVRGLALPTQLPDGTLTGEFQGFASAAAQGNADFEGGFYIDDEQAIKLLEAMKIYPGLKQGYSFLSLKEARPNSPYEPELAQAVNGYNCIDFVYFALNHAGILSLDQSEAFKVGFWYPEYFWDHTIPLKGTGKKIYKKFHDDGVPYMAREELFKLGMAQILFSSLEIFDEEKVVNYITETRPRLRRVRIWDQKKSIQWLEQNVDFRSLRLLEELVPLSKAETKITSPLVSTQDQLRFRSSKINQRYQKSAARRRLRKLKKDGLRPRELEEYRELEGELKRSWN